MWRGVLRLASLGVERQVVAQLMRGPELCLVAMGGTAYPGLELRELVATSAGGVEEWRVLDPARVSTCSVLEALAELQRAEESEADDLREQVALLRESLAAAQERLRTTEEARRTYGN